MQRKQFLQKMMRDLFEVKLPNYTQEGTDGSATIVNKSGLVDKCKFDGRQTMEGYASRFRILFEYTFIISNTTFELNSPDGNEVSRDQIIENATRFLIEQKVDIDKVNFTLYDKATLYLRIFSYYFISAIFSSVLGDFNYRNSQNKTISHRSLEFDDIDSVISDTVDRINHEICRIQLVQFGFVKVRNTQIFVDSKYRMPNNRGNYAIRLTPLQLNQFIESPIIPSYISFKRKRASNLNEELKSEDDNFFSRIIGDYIRYKPGEDIMYYSGIAGTIDTSCYSSALSYEISNDYPLSQINIEIPPIFTSDLFYITELSEEIIKRRYPNITTHEELHQQIIKRVLGERELINKFEVCRFSYYNNVISYVEDVLNGITKLLDNGSYSSINMDEGQGLRCLKCFNINPDEAMDFIKGGDSFNHDTAIQLYIGIQQGILSFADSLTRDDFSIVKSYYRYLGPERLKSHIAFLSNFIENPALDKGIQEQGVIVGNNPELYKSDWVLDKLNTHLFPNLFLTVKKIVMNYSIRAQEQLKL